MHTKRNENITLTLNSNMTKITLLSALTALLILPSIVSAATTADFNPGPGETASAGTWTRVLTVTTSAAGNAESKGAQTVDINVTSGVPDLEDLKIQLTVFILNIKLLMSNY